MKPGTQKEKHPISTKKLSENLFYYGVLAIPVIQFILFYVAVNFNSILLSFQSFDYQSGGFIFAGWKNFVMVGQDFSHNSTINYCFYNSAIIYLSGLLLTTPLSILFSYWLTMHKGFFAEFFKVMLFLPTIIPGIVLVMMFKYSVEGALPTILEDWFHVRLRLGLLFDTKSAIWMIALFGILTGFGTNMVLYTGAMSRVDHSLVEAAEMDGGNEWTILWHIILPAIYPTFTTMMVLSVAGYFTTQASLFSFYGGSAASQVYTWGYYLFVKVVGGDGSMADYPYAATYGLLFTLVAAPITLLLKYLMERFGPSSEKKEHLKHVSLKNNF
jgi:ABC-type sugar transport system permease subunit